MNNDNVNKKLRFAQHSCVYEIIYGFFKKIKLKISHLTPFKEERLKL
jgi:hypothetical protein